MKMIGTSFSLSKLSVHFEEVEECRSGSIILIANVIFVAFRAIVQQVHENDEVHQFYRMNPN